MASIAITEAELLEALARAAPDSAPEGAKTVQEMADAMHLHERTVRVALARCKRQGRLNVHPVLREGIDGRMCRVMAYTISAAAR